MVSSTYFIYTGQWNNFPCDNKKNYICSKPAVISGALLETLNTLIQKSSERINEDCCERGKVVSTESCGQGRSCDTICGADSATIVSPYEAASSQFCPGPTGNVREAFTKASLRSFAVRSFGIFGRIIDLWFCPSRVRTLNALPKYPSCCFHPFTRRVAGVIQKCCTDYSVCF
eukprot:GFUD01058064.1.p1 GENE.GFUD01058064.1~~GFUD01058064.1.p1  ORF type:complete len:173 (-),score=6.13 GFUD01058064.1:93-611(-)